MKQTDTEMDECYGMFKKGRYKQFYTNMNIDR